MTAPVSAYVPPICAELNNKNDGGKASVLPVKSIWTLPPFITIAVMAGMTTARLLVVQESEKLSMPMVSRLPLPVLALKAVIRIHRLFAWLFASVPRRKTPVGYADASRIAVSAQRAERRRSIADSVGNGPCRGVAEQWPHCIVAAPLLQPIFPLLSPPSASTVILSGLRVPTSILLAISAVFLGTTKPDMIEKTRHLKTSEIRCKRLMLAAVT